MIEILWQVTAPHFCAGLVTLGDTVVDAAPILRWTLRKSRAHLRSYFKRRGWIVRCVSKDPSPAKVRP